jgi:hypothetical protein
MIMVINKIRPDFLYFLNLKFNFEYINLLLIIMIRCIFGQFDL